MKNKHNSRSTRHHLVNRCNGGKTRPDNILNLWRPRHEAWHTLFNNMDLDQIINCLIRLKGLVARKE
jgi:hypothetical protein